MYCVTAPDMKFEKKYIFILFSKKILTWNKKKKFIVKAIKKNHFTVKTETISPNFLIE